MGGRLKKAAAQTQREEPKLARDLAPFCGSLRESWGSWVGKGSGIPEKEIKGKETSVGLKQVAVEPAPCLAAHLVLLHQLLTLDRQEPVESTLWNRVGLPPHCYPVRRQFDLE